MRIGFFGDSLTAGVPGSSFVTILRERFPDDTLLNYGKPNDTVSSLYRRISAMKLDEPLDIAFLWIGVNDVPQTTWWPNRAFSTIIAQQWAKDTDEFCADYRATLDFLHERAGHVIVAPPALKGENLENPWNRRLRELGGLIRELATEYESTEILDLPAIFARRLAETPGTDYTPTNPLRIILDVMTLRTDAQIDGIAAKRGLRLTLDGVHLNSAGAALVAEEYAAVIERIHSDAGFPFSRE